jgi:4-amino-4-deoxy-L-arabinose transferase-like glycosyltransferase
MREIPYKNYIVVIPVLILLIIQIPNLHLPYFYDEAWSYIPSIIKMAKAGPSLLPGVLPIDDCKGHPQFFFFISAVWMNLFSNNITVMRILPLLFSVGTLLTVYFGLKKLVNWESAIIASLLISVQSMFLAQSIFLLPEMLVTFFFVLSFFFFLNQQFLAYGITSTLMVLTKETSIIFPIIFGIFYLSSLLSEPNRQKFRHRYLLALIAPGIFYLIFLILHYMAFKVVLYSDHVGYIALDWPTIHDKLDRAYQFIFIGYGRRYISIAAILTLIIWLFQKPHQWRLILLGILSFVGFMLFSAINFYTQRYGLVAMVLFIILVGFIIGQLKINQYIKATIMLILASLCLYYSLTEKQNADIDLGYVETIKVHEDLVHYCQENNLYDEPLSVSFNMIFALREKDLGYVKGPRQFTKVMDWKQYMHGKYYIYESTMENNPTLDYAKEHFKLIKTFTRKHASGSIYENVQYQDSIKPANP